MNITLKQLTAFIELANCQSYAIAAQRLNISQPAISICIKNLEQEVGGELFNRSTRVVELTQEGKAFFPKAKRLLNDWNGTFEELHQLFTLQQGRLTIASMPSFAAFALPGVLKAFNQRYPNIRIDVKDVVMEKVLSSVSRGESDVGIVFEPDQIAELCFEPLMKNQFIAVVDAEHVLAGSNSLSLSEISDHPMVMMNRGSSIRQWLDKAFEKIGKKPVISVEAWQLDTLGEMVRAQLGIAVVPEMCRRQMLKKDLLCLSLDSSALQTRNLGLLYKNNGSVSSAAKVFIQLLKEKFAIQTES